jgi:hypothetical protein
MPIADIKPPLVGQPASGWVALRVALLLLLLWGLPGLHAQTTNWQPFVPFVTSAPLHDAAVVAQAISNVPLTAGLVFDGNGVFTNTQIWSFGTNIYTGIVDVAPTLERIRRGLSVYNNEFDDGGFFNFTDPTQLTNVPRMGNNYYMEFMVWPGADMDFDAGFYNIGAEPYGQLSWPGSMRLLVGLGGEVYFTGDHYGESGPQQDAYIVNAVPEASTIGMLLLAGLVFVLVRAGRPRAPSGLGHLSGNEP